MCENNRQENNKIGNKILIMFFRRLQMPFFVSLSPIKIQ